MSGREADHKAVTVFASAPPRSESVSSDGSNFPRYFMSALKLLFILREQQSTLPIVRFPEEEYEVGGCWASLIGALHH